ncbi:DUF6049 family protein [Actinotalea sp. K2]|uniref:DUF6049 family protein n=1 Tax=Actinotalea sp. K2 TaxID=2939438 RepID=UPI0020181737|nr:DUF6049 family protein [Actinotalea sp. K2]MCL3860745.1 DUF6049 family protein [Actinotalea sp. K2]
MTSTRPRAHRLALVLTLPLLLVLPLLAVVGAPVAAATTTPEDGSLPVEVTVTGVSPQVLRPGEDLTVTATLHNTGSATLAEPRVIVRINRDGFISRSSLDTWTDAGPDGRSGAAILDIDLPSALAPGATVTARGTVPAGSIGLRTGATSWGPRGLALEVVDVADPARARQGLGRTFALWFPEQEVTGTRLTVLVPVVGPVGDRQQLVAETSVGGRLTDVLAATGEHREVTWVVDPAVLEGAVPGQGTPESSADGPVQGDDGQDGDDQDAEAEDAATDDPTATDPSAETTDPTTGAPAPTADAASDWADDLVAAMVGRDVALLPHSDPDLAALAHVGAGDLLDLAIDRSAQAAREGLVPEGASTTLAWPADPLPDLPTAAFALRHDARALVVGPGELTPPSVLTYTPTGRATLPTASGDVTAIIGDERLSTALRAGSVPRTVGTDALSDERESARAASPAASPVEATQALLAELAVITRERPSDSRHLLVVVPRDWHPDPTTASAQLEGLGSVPWVQMEPVAALVGADDPEVDRGSLPERTVDPTEVDAATLESSRAAVAERELFAQIAQDPSALLGDPTTELLAPTSVAWRADPAGRAALVEAAVTRTRALTQVVTVIPGSTLNIISASGDLPVRLSNALDQQVTVVVALRPGNSQLRVDDDVAVTIEANGEALAQIPVHAISSADVDVVVELQAADGTVLDRSTSFTVRVRADWEGIGTAVIGGLLALGLVFGLARSIRRGRTGRRAAPVDSGPDALSPEQVVQP